MQSTTAPHIKHATYATYLKRAFDVSVVVGLAPVVLPIVLLAALAVSLGHGSPFYVQDRLGRGGRPFRMWKLRSMVPDAEQVLCAHLARDPAAHQEWDTYQKLRNDPRITRIGRFLRKTSIDELPQLWNVLKGDMSLVGPRPMMIEQRRAYPGASYFALRPGITGYWQVFARNEASFADRARYDDAYTRDLSFGRDVAILLLTLLVLLKATGH